MPSPYRNGFGPTPAPACDVIVRIQGGHTTIQGVIDSGASRTAIPTSVVAQLHIRRQGDIRTSGAYGGSQLRGLYVVDLELLGREFPSHPVGEVDRPYALIGRDILNRYVTTLDGPALQFDM